MATLQLSVSGMKCTACEKKIVEGLQAVEGVSEVKADHKAGLVELVYDPDKVQPSQIEEAISGLGFQVVQEEARSETQKSSILQQILSFFRS